MAAPNQDEAMSLNGCHNDPDVSSRRYQWSNKFQNIIMLLGYSVGLGNLWRFPYVCQKNGGGAFLIPYVIVTAVLTVPLFYLELYLGQFSRQGPMGVWGICPLMSGIGISMLVANMLITPFYSTVLTWSLYYLYKSFSPVLPWTTCGNTWNTPDCVVFGEIGGRDITGYHNNLSYTLTTLEPERSYRNSSKGHTSTEEFWQFNTLGISSGIDKIGSVQLHLLLCWFLVCFGMFCCVMRGVKSLLKVVYVTALCPYLLLVVLLIRSCMMPGAIDGVYFFVTPKFSQLLDFQVWLEAFIQSFFSVGTAWGPVIVMASHNPSNNNIAMDSLIVIGLGELTSVFAGFVVFTTVGALAHSLNIPIADVISSGPGTGFIVYAGAVSQLPVSQCWSVLLFLVFLMMGIDSVFAHVEAVVGCMEDLLSRKFQIRHLQTLLAAVFILYVFLAGLVFTTDGGVYVFQLMDWYTSAFFIFVISLMECVAVGWLYGIKRFSSDVLLMTGRSPPVLYKVLSCIVIPVVMLVIIADLEPLVVLVMALLAYKPPTYGSYVYPQYAVVIGWCVAMVSVIPIPIVMVVKVLREHGTLFKRLTNAMKPDSARQRYRHQHGCHEHPKPATLIENFLFIFSRK